MAGFWCLTEVVLLYFPSHQRNAGPHSCSVSRTASPAFAIRIQFPSHISLLAMEFPTLCGFKRKTQRRSNKFLFGHKWILEVPAGLTELESDQAPKEGKMSGVYKHRKNKSPELCGRSVNGMVPCLCWQDRGCRVVLVACLNPVIFT